MYVYIYISDQLRILGIFRAKDACESRGGVVGSPSLIVLMVSGSKAILNLN